MERAVCGTREATVTAGVRFHTYRFASLTLENGRVCAFSHTHTTLSLSPHLSLSLSLSLSRPVLSRPVSRVEQMK